MSFYKAKIFLITIILILTSFNTPAQAAVSADCIEFSNPRSSTGTTSITLEVDLYSICSKVVREYDNPVYEMVEEDSLLNLSSCSGPFIKSAGTLGRMYLGTIRCSLRINQYLGSSRTGSTSTSIKVWFAWDFSTKKVSISHSAIPKYSSSGSGSSVPVVPSCTSAPSIPTLTYEVLDSGLNFSFAPLTSGSAATSLYWNYVYFDSKLLKWDAWSPLVAVIPAKASQFLVPKMVDKSKAAFAVYASNNCGTSEAAREIMANTGVSFELPINTITSNYIKPNFTINELVPLNGFSKAISGALVSYQVLTPEVCSIDKDLFLSFQGRGNCNLSASVPDVTGYKKLEPNLLTFFVTSISTISCKKGKTTKNVNGVNPKCPAGYKKV
jgi:hypothetical protein